MFYKELKEKAEDLYNGEIKKYKESVEKVNLACDQLYESRKNAMSLINDAESLINSIAHTPKEFNVELSKFKVEIEKYKGTEEYDKEAQKNSALAGIGVLMSAVLGAGVADYCSNGEFSILNILARSWRDSLEEQEEELNLGETFTNTSITAPLTKYAGPIGVGVAGVGTLIIIVNCANKNKKMSKQMMDDALKITKAWQKLEETTEKITATREETDCLAKNIGTEMDQLQGLRNCNFHDLTGDNKKLLGAFVNQLIALTMLMNETIEQIIGAFKMKQQNV